MHMNSKLKTCAIHQTPELSSKGKKTIRSQKDLLVTPILWFPLNCELLEPWENYIFDVF